MENHPYTSIGKASQTIGTSGCGPTCSAMVVSSIKGTIRPDEMGDLYVKYGYRSAMMELTFQRFNGQLTDLVFHLKEYGM